MRVNFGRTLALYRYRILWPSLVIAVLLLGVAATGCVSFGRGAYQVDIFSEMHYTQMYRSQEPPRLYPATGSVPFQLVGSGPLVVEELTVAMTAGTVDQGKALFGVNCVVCHGVSGTGDGPMRDFLIKWQGIPPVDITGSRTREFSDDTLLNIISAGGFIATTLPAGTESPSVMPVFKKLLTQEEQWMLVYYIRDLQGQ